MKAPSTLADRLVAGLLDPDAALLALPLVGPGDDPTAALLLGATVGRRGYYRACILGEVSPPRFHDEYLGLLYGVADQAREAIHAAIGGRTFADFCDEEIERRRDSNDYYDPHDPADSVEAATSDDYFYAFLNSAQPYASGRVLPSKPSGSCLSCTPVTSNIGVWVFPTAAWFHPHVVVCGARRRELRRHRCDRASARCLSSSHSR